MAQARTRVLLRGIHKIYSATSAPPILPAFGIADLDSVLAKGLPPIRARTLSKTMQQNLKFFSARIKQCLERGECQASDVIVCCLDRAPGKAWPALMFINYVPTLTCGNKYLFLVRASDFNCPEQDRSLWRFLTCAERYLLQGKDPKLAVELPEKDGYKCTGNAYPTPLMCAGTMPLLRSIGEGGLDHESAFSQ